MPNIKCTVLLRSMLRTVVINNIVLTISINVGLALLGNMAHLVALVAALLVLLTVTCKVSKPIALVTLL